MNQIINFTYENANIRTITEDGTPLFLRKRRSPHPQI